MGEGMCGKGGCAWQGWVSVVREACMAGGVCMTGGGVVGETTTASDGMYPTGMYSCFISSTHKTILDMRHNVHLYHWDTLLHYNNHLCDNTTLPQ